jgi:macrolide-specific efflux system membrane fusion protein
MPVYRPAVSKWILGLCVLTLFLAGCSAQPQAEVATPTPLPTPVIPTKPTYTVQKGEVVRKSEFTARLVPVVQQELYFKTGGRIQSVLVQKGDQVKKDQVLAQLESGTSDVDLRRAQINLETAKLNKELYMMDANKFSKEYPIYLKMKDYDIELAQLALDELNAKIDTTQIKAPFDGTVLSVYITPDTSVEAYKSVIVLADLNNIEVSADLTSTDLQVLQEGMPVQVYAVSGPATVLNGEIRKLPYPYGKASQSSQNETQDTSTRVSLSDPPAKANLTLGDLVRVQVVLEKKDNTLWLPPQAIRKFEGRRFVVVQDGSGQRRVDVTIGITSDDRVEITDGLTEGQTVVAP